MHEFKNDPPVRVLAVCAIDLMAWKLLRPWLQALSKAGYEVHIACAKSSYFELLRAEGFHMHDIPIRRQLNPLVNVGPFWKLYRLMRQERYDVVNAHSPVAAAIARMAAHLAGSQLIGYTVHGFYFHDDMARWKRRAFIAVEWLLGRITNSFMFVSDEDRQTALREGIVKSSAEAITIYNGVELQAFPPRDPASSVALELRDRLNIPKLARVVGIVGRVVREKGYIEFVEMAKSVSVQWPEALFLVVGDALPSDRDGIVEELRKRIVADGLTEKFRFAGFTDRVADHLQIMDIFVLPSYREGFPRSVLEAMSTALPVVATNIRGCREAVVHGETGLLIPPRNSAALAEAVNQLLRNTDRTVAMGRAGRERAERLYSHDLVQDRFVATISAGLATPRDRSLETAGGVARRFAELIVAGTGLLVFAPLLAAITGLLRLKMGPHPIFAQRRVGLRDRIFVLYKFRTMTNARDDNGNLLPDERRLTALGRFLRSTSLDELPQLWNVLRGDMSLVGPRPLLPEYLPRYNAFQRRRHEVKPGITGWVQVNGRNALTWEQKFELDVWYVDHQSIRLDLKILWMTFLKVIRRDGISKDGHATMPEFHREQPSQTTATSGGEAP